MDYSLHSFRHGLEHVSESDLAWTEILEMVTSISRSEIVLAQITNLEKWQAGAKSGKKFYKPPVGAQDVLNKIILAKFKALGEWDSQVYVLRQGKERLVKSEKVPYWSMDFRKNKIGVEISFNNAGVLAQNLLRLSVMSESKYLEESQTIKLGVLIVSEESLKVWGSMDTTVVTFEQVMKVLPHVNFSIPTPIIIVGIRNSSEGKSWSKTALFGTKKENLPAYKDLGWEDKKKWNQIIETERNLSL